MHYQQTPQEKHQGHVENFIKIFTGLDGIEKENWNQESSHAFQVFSGSGTAAPKCTFEARRKIILVRCIKRKGASSRKGKIANLCQNNKPFFFLHSFSLLNDGIVILEHRKPIGQCFSL